MRITTVLGCKFKDLGNLEVTNTCTMGKNCKRILTLIGQITERECMILKLGDGMQLIIGKNKDFKQTDNKIRR